MTVESGTGFFNRPEKIFLFLALFYGLIFLLMTPPFDTPDETTHFFRAYQVSEGGIFAQKRYAEVMDSEFEIVNNDGDCYRIINGTESGPPVNLHSIFPSYKMGHFASILMLNAFYARASGIPRTFFWKSWFGSEWRVDLINDKGGVLVYAKGAGDLAGAYLPASLQTVTNQAMGDIFEHTEKGAKFGRLAPLLKIPLDPANRAFAEFPNTALYSPVPYIPQAAGIAITRALGLPPLVLSYAGRTFNLFAWILLVYFAIKISPAGKWLFSLLALMPTSLFLASSLSADAFTNGVSFFLISLLLRYSLVEGEDGKVGKAAWIAIPASSVLVALSKQVYFPLVFLSLLVPAGKFGKGKKYALLTGACALSLSAGALWSLAAGKIFVPLFHTQPARQMEFILHEPLKYALILARGVFSSATVSSFISELGWRDKLLPSWLIWSYMVMLVIAGLASGAARLDVRKKILMAAVIIPGSLLACTAVYMAAVMPKGELAPVFQGRYLIPFAPVTFLLLSNSKVRSGPRKLAPAFAVYSVLLLSYTVYRLFSRFYLGAP